MEAIFLSSTKGEKLVALSNSLHSELLNHVEVIQISLRSYRNYLEEALGKLRDSNVDFLKACRLFSEGGNFSPEEVELFCKCLEKETGRIDFIEGLIMIYMEKMESNYLEQATEVINKCETKFHNLAMDRLFMEKIQRFLTNLQVKIKSEVANSNLQAQTLNSSLEKFLKKIDVCAHPTADKEAEGIKIRDDEEHLKAALKRQEKHKAQPQKQWEKRTEHVVEEMQQDKQRKNIQKKKVAKVECRKDKARKKGRILPEDLEKAGVK